MTNDDSESLRRIAYGPDATGEERAAAEAALRDAERLAVRGSVAVSTTVDADTDVAGGIESVPRERQADVARDNDRPRGIRRACLILIIVAAIGVGALGSFAVTGLLGNQPASIAPSEQPSIPPLNQGEVGGRLVGDLGSVDRLFNGAPGPKDVFPDAALLEKSFIDPTNVRFLLSAQAEKAEDDFRMWAAKNRADEVCLIIVMGDGDMTGRSCVSRADFRRDGLAFGANQFRVSWNGVSVSVERTLN